MRAVGARNTTPELIVRASLHRFGCRFALHRSDLPGKPDIVMPARNRIVLVHGCFWHSHTCSRGKRAPVNNRTYWEAKRQRNGERDNRTVAALRRLGWRVLVVWECQARDQRRLASRLQKFLVDR